MDPDVAARLSASDRHAVGLRDGSIVWVGDASDARWAIGHGTRVIDLGDGVVVPGLVDTHAHLASLGKVSDRLDVTGCQSMEAVAQRVRSHRQGQGWLLGHGWDQNRWGGGGYPDHRPLTEAAPHRSVALRRIDEHALWVNGKAMEEAGVHSQTPDPPGGRLLRDPVGRPTGIFIDEAMALIEDVQPAPSVEDLRRWTREAVARCHRVGLTGVHDAGADLATLSAYESLDEERDLGLRVHVLVNGQDDLEWSATLPGPRRRGFVHVAGIKLFLDGALGSHGAWMREPYSDNPGWRGLPLLRGEALRAPVRLAYARGLQVGAHAIGDGAVREVLDAFAEVLQPGNDRRFRVEHAQVVDPADRSRMAKLAVLAMIQPTHATSDMDWAERRLGAVRIQQAYAWRSLLRDGVRVGLGSDFPIEKPDPCLGLYAAVSRCRRGHASDPAWRAEEALTPFEALRGFTTDAAFAGFDEARRGRIAVGADADLTVLSDDPLTCSTADLESLVVWQVFVNGERVYTR